MATRGGTRSTAAGTPSAPHVPGGAFEFTDTAPSTPVAREVLFTYRGKEHTIPVDFELGDAMEYAHIARTQGPDKAVDFALELALGTAGYAALRAVRGLKPVQLERIVGMVTTRVAGGGTSPK